jgi:hypothetical protein
MSSNTSPLQGRCYCGAVTYEVADEFEYSLICHCTDCQRATGSAFKPFAGIAAEHLTVTQGQDRLQIYGHAQNHNAHCRDCGSLLYSLVREGKYVHVTLGTLATPPSCRPSAHIFVRSKAPWHVIGDDLPQFESFRPPPPRD